MHGRSLRLIGPSGSERVVRRRKEGRILVYTRGRRLGGRKRVRANGGRRWRMAGAWLPRVAPSLSCPSRMGGDQKRGPEHVLPRSKFPSPPLSGAAIFPEHFLDAPPDRCRDYEKSDTHLNSIRAGNIDFDPPRDPCAIALNRLKF